MSSPVIVPVAGGKGRVKIAVIATGSLVQTFGSVSCSLIMYYCSTTGKPTRSFATERVSLDSV
jgi:hypothetical protein